VLGFATGSGLSTLRITLGSGRAIRTTFAITARTIAARTITTRTVTAIPIRIATTTGTGAARIRAITSAIPSAGTAAWTIFTWLSITARSDPRDFLWF
jgi:C4-dicarboxylate transporter